MAEREDELSLGSAESIEGPPETGKGPEGGQAGCQSEFAKLVQLAPTLQTESKNFVQIVGIISGDDGLRIGGLYGQSQWVIGDSGQSIGGPLPLFLPAAKVPNMWMLKELSESGRQGPRRRVGHQGRSGRCDNGLL